MLRRPLSQYLLAILLFVTAFLPLSPATASAVETSKACIAYGNLSEDPVAVAKSSGRWTCNDPEYSLEAERAFLRFDIGVGEVLPGYFFSRQTAFEAIHLLAFDRDGSIRRVSQHSSQLHSSLSGGFFKAALPQVTRATQYVVVVLDMPSHRMILERAHLAPSDLALDPDVVRYFVLLAALAGMLLMPLIFNSAFYRVLREQFVLWHSALTISLLLTILASSGLAVVLIDPPAMTLSWMQTVIFGMTIASGAMFTWSFIEPGKMHPWLRRALPYCAAWAMSIAILHAAFPYVARSVQSPVYTAAFAPVLLIFMLSIVDSLLRGSRAAKFQAIGYAPMVVVGLIRLITGIVPAFESNDAMTLFYIGCVVEVLFTTMGVADRFMTMRRQRDRARTEADVLERVSECDALTGLMNRRAIERHFETYRADGYDTVAVLDLDHFKAINDTYGHSVGDAVLKATAEALQADPAVHAFRIGGEEFLLLLRGEDAHSQAERRRQAIPAIVANAVPGLERPVTASMGLVNAKDDSFAELYTRADKLLYEAKSAGRNRTMAQEMQDSPRETAIEAAA